MTVNVDNIVKEGEFGANATNRHNRNPRACGGGGVFLTQYKYTRAGVKVKRNRESFWTFRLCRLSGSGSGGRGGAGTTGSTPTSRSTCIIVPSGIPVARLLRVGGGVGELLRGVSVGSGGAFADNPGGVG